MKIHLLMFDYVGETEVHRAYLDKENATIACEMLRQVHRGSTVRTNFRVVSIDIDDFDD